ncbi:MAG: hypothetical protein UZ11_BCD004001077 [Bacteroidetes bacterium OLB11]|nr:MAG: hypothetical protein UZ11_BCD004001077 [Bacteroidetes bacterium OLB11]
MYPFIETIHIEHQQAYELERHLLRMQKTCIEYYNQEKKLNEVQADILHFASQTKIKTKLSLHYNIDKHTLLPTIYYQKNIETFFLIENNEIDYHLKYADRNSLNQLKLNIKNEDEIIIVKDGKITDTSFSNICFFKQNQWVTPNTPLLNGIKRQKYLDEKKNYFTRNKSRRPFYI